MDYQVVLKKYRGSVPVCAEKIFLTREEKQEVRARNFPCVVLCERKREGEKETFFLKARMTGDLQEPFSLSLQAEKTGFDPEEYVFFPAAVYDGNRMESRFLPYPPYHQGRKNGKWDRVITDIPHLDAAGADSRIQLRSGDMSTPAMGYWDGKQKEGVLLFGRHRENGAYTGFSVSRKGKEETWTLSCPAVREEYKYFFGELPDGSGFYPTAKMPSDDSGIVLKRGESLELSAAAFCFGAESLADFFREFERRRETMETGEEFFSIPFSRGYDAVKEKFVARNFAEEGYYRVGTENEAPPSFWQAGWVGGGMNTWPFLQEDRGKAREQALSTLGFITKRLQWENGWYIPMYARGIVYGDDFRDTDRPVVLVRKNGDLLYFLLKQAMYLRETETDSDELLRQLSRSVHEQAAAFVRLFRKNGQVGQFIHAGEETVVQGDTACGAIVPAALALAYEYFGEGEFLEVAEELLDLYRKEFLGKGIVNGGPGEICQAPDSESAFALLESCVQLCETTGEKRWLAAAEEAFSFAVTWAVSYDFHFPEESAAAGLGAHTRGTVFANVQNKHSAPGICTLSGNSLLKLYRFTGEKRYLEWMKRISHALSQFVSLPERPVDTLAGKPLPSGYMNERVQTSDWEGKETVGEFLYGSNWPEATLLLTYVEVPGIYLDQDRGTLVCCDHVEAEPVEEDEGKGALRVHNPTRWDARVNLLVDRSMAGGKLGHLYFDRMERISIKAGETKRVPLP